MFMSKRLTRGFTLVELIIFIVVVSIGLAGILSVMNTVVKSSADPMVSKQALAIAGSLLEEILLKEYCDPDTVDATAVPPVCDFNTREASRNLFDNVDDYAGYSTTAGVVDLEGAAQPGLAQYNIASVTVAATTALTGVAAREVTVVVQGPAVSVSLSGYRANY